MDKLQNHSNPSVSMPVDGQMADDYFRSPRRERGREKTRYIQHKHIPKEESCPKEQDDYRSEHSVDYSRNFAEKEARERKSHQKSNGSSGRRKSKERRVHDDEFLSSHEKDLRNRSMERAERRKKSKERSERRKKSKERLTRHRSHERSERKHRSREQSVDGLSREKTIKKKSKEKSRKQRRKDHSERLEITEEDMGYNSKKTFGTECQDLSRSHSHKKEDGCSHRNEENVHKPSKSKRNISNKVKYGDTNKPDCSKRDKRDMNPKPTRHTGKAQARLYYSDSEVEIINRKSKKKCSNSSKTVPDSSSSEKPINIDALYNLFYRDTDVHNESLVIKEAIKKKISTNKKLDQNVVSNETDIKNLKPVLLDQSNIRSKLIKVLFQRVKDLLKETEELREERKQLNEKIETLTSEAEKLRQKEVLQNTQEKKIQERLEILANEMKVTAKGTSFREEVHNILHDIQNKYRTHWKEHENKIQQVQTDAEQEIQTLMRNIVAKYVQLTELKERTKVSADIADKTIISKPLYIDTTDYTQPNYRTANQVSASEETRGLNGLTNTKSLLLKMSAPLRPLSIDCITTNEHKSCKYNYKCDSLLMEAPDGKDSSTPSESQVSNGGLEKRVQLSDGGHEKRIQLSERGFDKTCDDNFKIPNHIEKLTTAHKTYDAAKTSYRHSLGTKYIPSYEKTVHSDNTTKYSNKTPQSLKMDSKEFWRQRLLQPNPIGPLRRDEKEEENLGGIRNQY